MKAARGRGLKPRVCSCVSRVQLPEKEQTWSEFWGKKKSLNLD